MFQAKAAMLILPLLSLIFTDGKVVLKSAESDFLPDDDVTQQPHKPHKPDMLDRRLKPEETRKIAAEDDDGHKVEREREREKERERKREKEGDGVREILGYSGNRLVVYDIRNVLAEVIVTGMCLFR